MQPGDVPVTYADTTALEEDFGFKLLVVHNTRREHEVQKFALFIAYEMKFEPEEPSHGALAYICYSIENLTRINSLVATYSQWWAVNNAVGNHGDFSLVFLKF